MKVVSSDALTKLIQLSKDEFLSKNNTTTVTTSGLKTINGTSILGTGDIDTSELPSQTGQNGKFLTTNGTTASWTTISTGIQNLATGTDGLALLGESSGSYAIAIGKNTQANVTRGLAVGYAAKALQENSIGLGYLAQANGSFSIQVGPGTNANPNTLSVGLSGTGNYELLNAAGNIPPARLNGAIQLVSALPASPTEGVLYLIAE